jgi:uncharacterized protein (TIGR00251 family)
MDARIAQDTEDGAVLSVHVQPNASRTECAGLHGDALKIRIAAPPVDGAANDELTRFVAARCAVPRANVVIRSGAEGRRKRLLIKGVTAESAMARLTPAGTDRHREGAKT